VTFVPSFVLVSTLGWVSSLRGLIVPGLFQAFATFLFRQYFLGFPQELADAARIDGLGYLGTFWRVVVPNSLGFVAAIGTITFIGS
jgi:multiple sugar transport system permease protein